jgi:serine/threonine protein kinase
MSDLLETESEHGIFNSILRGQVDFTSDPWPRISSGAKDLVRKMLTSDPKRRISAYDVLSKSVSLLNFSLLCSCIDTCNLS